MAPNDRTPLLGKKEKTSDGTTWLLVVASALLVASVAFSVAAALHFVAWVPLTKIIAVRLCTAAPCCFGAGIMVLGKVLTVPPDSPTLDKKASSAPRKQVSSRVHGLIKSIGSAAEQQRRQAEEDQLMAAAAAEACEAGTVQQRAVLDSPPPVQQVGEDEWRIHGMYEHQVLKSGLRHLDDTWSEDGLFDLPASRFGTKDVFAGRGKLILELLRAGIQLKSVPAPDLTAAQYGLRSLSLRQLLRLRVLHIDFTPSGCGSNVVGMQGGAHEAFMSVLDRQLFDQLGSAAIGRATTQSTDLIHLAEVHRFGREAVLLAAAASVISSPLWWSWWLSPSVRVFFNAERFTSVTEFPDGDVGVLEVVDCSKQDRHEPTGHLRWLDWRVMLIKQKENLSTTAPGSAQKAPESAETSPVAPEISAALLIGTRSSLRKTGLA